MSGNTSAILAALARNARASGSPAVVPGRAACLRQWAPMAGLPCLGRTGLALEGGLHLAALERIGFGHSWPHPLARLSHLCWRMDYRSHEQKEGTVIDSTDPDLLWAWTAGLCLVNFSQFRFNQENTR